MSIILHITHRDTWEQAAGEDYFEAPSLELEGFIHCSTKGQAVGTANRLFRGAADLILLCIEEERLEAKVEYEPPKKPETEESERDELYPHVYGPINTSAVIRVVGFGLGPDGRFELPDEIEDL